MLVLCWPNGAVSCSARFYWTVASTTYGSPEGLQGKFFYYLEVRRGILNPDIIISDLEVYYVGSRNNISSEIYLWVQDIISMSDIIMSRSEIVIPR